ncbi:hypothetical protein, partial [Leyella stercorea]|uniref:hypothetical protein n=1 Tax=Leyella stercorea TaxID=363265 RepID=UPI001F37DF87
IYMGKIKGFLFAVRHREILMTDLGLSRTSRLTDNKICTGLLFCKLSELCKRIRDASRYAYE